MRTSPSPGPARLRWPRRRDPIGAAAAVLDLTGVFAFALNGALTALKAARLDLVGVLTLAGITALGGGIIRDVVLGATPPATFADARYLAVAAAGGLLAFLLGHASTGSSDRSPSWTRSG